ncbi:hypothetical protein ACFQFQ_11590 [Sulfitobacter porphyrae]|uniref:Peptidylprolyl isomerase n=1 Tax=Sulfitobacter porphyrae TaxID=1246864 RepID=A0ABW2B4N0_9RHOB
MALGLALCLLVPPAVMAQNLYAPVARVNDRIVTEFEVQQRQRFMQLLNAPGSDRENVIDELIKDRLRDDLAARYDLKLSDEAVQSGLSDFATAPTSAWKNSPPRWNNPACRSRLSAILSSPSSPGAT